MLTKMLQSRAGLVAMLLALGTMPVIAGDSKTGDVPFEMLISNHMVVTAKINDKGPYRLIFDLGAPITLLSNRAAEGSGVLKKSAPKSFLFAMRGEATVKSLEVGTLKAKDLPVVVLDHPALSVACPGRLGERVAAQSVLLYLRGNGWHRRPAGVALRRRGR